MADEKEKRPVVATLRLPDGRSFDCHSEVERQYLDTQLFWWTEGNGSCDCNRSLDLNREHHLDLGEPDENGEYGMACGDFIALTSLVVDGAQRL